jgi:hypothetical protein
MTDLRTRTLRVLLAAALAVGVATTTTTAAGALTVQQARNASPTAEPQPEPDGDAPAPADHDCDPEAELCAHPVDPGEWPECPEIPTAGGSSIPDPGCDPDPCPEVTYEEGDEPQLLEIDPECLPCPLDEELDPVRTDPEERREPRRTDPCDPPVDECEDAPEEGRQLRSGDDDVVELQLERPGDGRDDCEPGRPNFTG